jgi:hypothetical protein
MTAQGTHRGLRPEIRKALRDVVLAAIPNWRNLPPTDLWRVERRTEAGTWEISLEPRKGMRAFLGMSRALASEANFIAARDLVLKIQPELSGWIGSCQGGVALQFDNIVMNLVAQVEKLELNDADIAVPTRLPCNFRVTLKNEKHQPCEGVKI